MRTRGLSRSSKLKSEGRTPILAWPHDESNLSLWSNYWENEGWRADSTVKARLATNKKNVRAAENCRCWCTDPISSCFTTSLEYVFFTKKFWEVRDGDVSPVSPKRSTGLQTGSQVMRPGVGRQYWARGRSPRIALARNCGGLSHSFEKPQAGSIQLGFFN